MSELEFEDWFDQAIDKELFPLAAPSAQYKTAKAAWDAGIEVGKKLIKDKVSKRFAISHIDWREYE